MVDNMNPSNQFHPYQPETSTPHTEAASGGLGDMLRNVNLRNVNTSDMMNNARVFARKNPGAVLGGLAALAIGAGLLRRRS